MKEEKISAILDEDMEQVLESIGQLHAIKNGEIYCSECGTTISIENIQLIIPLENGYFEYVCKNTLCVHSYSEVHEVTDARI